MTIDARAYAWCNLGQLAPGESTIGDDHVQGSGLCMTKGTIRLLGVVRPPAGTVVELAYSDGRNRIARIPRRLRVLSSSISPTGTPITTVSVGCDLAFAEGRKPVTSNPTNREANSSLPEDARRIASQSIPASWLVDRILAATGISPAGVCPLSNQYLQDAFDMSAGYVQELGRLLVSEGYFGWMNEAGRLQYIYKGQSIGSGILLTQDDLIEINPINSGELPGESVFARYKTLRLKTPPTPSTTQPGAPGGENDRARRNWEEDLTISMPQKHTHRWTVYERVPVLDANGNATYKQSRDREGIPLYEETTGEPVMEQVYERKAVQKQEKIIFTVTTRTTTKYDGADRVTTRTTETSGLWGTEITETSFSYNGDDIDTETTVAYSPKGTMLMQLGVNDSFFNVYGGLGVVTGDVYISSRREIQYEKNAISGITKTVNRNWTPYVSTEDGGEAISRMRDANVAVATMFNVAVDLIESGSSVNIRTEREYGIQRRPPEVARLSAVNQKKDKDKPDAYEVAGIAWAMGSPASLTMIELSPPYVTDDRLIWTGNDWLLILGDAPQKALNYARIENRLRLGHRNGLSIQLLPEHVPTQPFGLVFIRLAGATGAYRLNGTTYTISPDGCVASSDALFWGAIDASSGASPWFLMPPSAVTLPAPVTVTTNPNPQPANSIPIPEGFNPQAPNLTTLFAALPTGQAAVDPSTVSPSVLVLPYHETVDLDLGAGIGALIELQPWVAADPVDLLVGIGAGVDVAVLMVAGIGAGVVIDAQGGAPTLSPLLNTISGSAEILDSSNLNPAPGSSYAYAWDTDSDAEPMVIFMQFTLSQAITIAGVGIYDHQQNGLAQAHGISLWDYDTLTAITLNYGGGSGSLQVTIPSGTAASLVGSYRVVPLASPQTLAAGTYWLGATMPTTGADAIAAIPIGSGSWNSAVVNNGSQNTAGLKFQYVESSNPQVSFDVLNDPFFPGDPYFKLSSGQRRVPIGPMLFVAA